MRTLAEYASLVEQRLPEYLPAAEEGGLILNHAMRYSLLAGGKRLRPSMVLAAVEMLGGDGEEAMPFACAVEMIHTYSLIHDDLPGMDNDTLRRGRPTNHMVFGEGQAILAGDGLLSLAFETMLAQGKKRPERAEAYLSAIAEIATGAGAGGMVAGQSLDLEYERNGSPADREDALFRVQRGKTACMFLYPLRAAGKLAEGTEETLRALEEYGRAFGMLFQATDDLLDVLGETEEVGKTLGKDAQSGKLTCISVFGVEGTRALVRRERARAEAALERFGKRAEFFLELVRKMENRVK